MRFHQPVGVIPQSNDFINVNINANLIGSQANNQLTRLSGNNFRNITQSLNLTEIKSTRANKQNESTNNFNSANEANKVTTLEDILKLKSDSKYFAEFFGSKQTDTASIDVNNGNDEFLFVESLNFRGATLTEVGSGRKSPSCTFPTQGLPTFISRS
jgi:hypothetical protein